MLNLLDGIRIVDVTTIVMGPMASQMLADLGADVVKVEPLSGDLARQSGTMGPDGMGALFANNNRNKKSLALDLRKAEGKEILEKLLERSDVLLHNMRPKAAERLDLSRDAVRRINPAIIHCAAVGFGSGGPYAGRAAYDDVIQAVSGLASLSLEVGGEPQYVPSIMADKTAAMHVVYAILAALLKRERTGEACAVEVPMFESMVAFLMNEHLDAASFDVTGKPGYSRLLNPNRRPYRTADGWLAVMPYSGEQWQRTLAELGLAAVMEEPWFSSAAGRNSHSQTLYGLLADVLPGRTTAQWMGVFARLDVPHAMINRLEDLLDDPHLDAVDFFKPSDGLRGRKRSVPQPVRFSHVEERPDFAPPALGADSRTILAELGYTEDHIDRLVGAGIVPHAQESDR